MKTMRLFLVVFFACALCLSAVPGSSWAATDTKEVTVPSVMADSLPKVTPGDHKGKGAIKASKAAPKDVNINTADKDLLVLLPGVGPVTADAILAYRQEKGKFTSVDELVNVKGIGEKNLAKLKPYLQAI